MGLDNVNASAYSLSMHNTKETQMKVNTPNGPAVLESATEAKDGGVLFLARHRNGSTWMYAPVEIEPRTAKDAASLDAFIETCMNAARKGRAFPAIV